jgi:hypothetical protein
MAARWMALASLLFLLTGCEAKGPPPVNCADLTKGCTTHGIEVHVDQPPSALHPFLLSVRAPGAHEVSAEFVMSGMEMGLNRYRLMAQQDGLWQARVTLPVCVSGRRDWVLWLEVDGQRHGLAFETGSSH